MSVPPRHTGILDACNHAWLQSTGYTELIVSILVCRNGRSGEELHRMERPVDREWPGGNWKSRPTIRTQRTKLQSALLAHVPPGVIRLSKKLDKITDLGDKGIELQFADGTSETADLVVGADGIRSVC